MPTPTIWCIGAIDSTGFAGLSADTRMAHALSVHAAPIVSALTNQTPDAVHHIEPTDPKLFRETLCRLQAACPPAALKIGLLGHAAHVTALCEHLKKHPTPVVLDPVFSASNGDNLLANTITPDALQALLPWVTCLTPNGLEAAQWLQCALVELPDPVTTAQALQASLGCQTVLLKGGHTLDVPNNVHCDDIWSDGQDTLCLRSPRLARHARGTGCNLATALAAALALGYDPASAAIFAKMCLNQGLQKAGPLDQPAGPLPITGWPADPTLRPAVWSPTPRHQRDDLLEHISSAPPAPGHFPALKRPDVGYYPLVSDHAQLKHCLTTWPDVHTYQLRIKSTDTAYCRQEISQCIQTARNQPAPLALFINDHWQLAIELGAYGVHLGQSDLNPTALAALAQAGLRLGISTHTLAELAQAATLNPSYIAIGPIKPTTSKTVPYPPVGWKKLSQYSGLIDCPVVIIGGLTPKDLNQAQQCGAAGIALLSQVPGHSSN